MEGSVPDVLAVREAVAQAARWLPHQGPLSVFIHHNTLSELEHLDFQEALALAERSLDARVRLPERDYREMLADGRILQSDLAEVFEAENIPERSVDEALPDERAFAWAMLTVGFRETHWRIRAFQIAEGQPDPVVASLDTSKQARLTDEARRLFASDADAAVFWLTGTREISLSRRRLREQHALSDTREATVACMRDPRRAAELGYALLSGIARAHLPSRPAPEELVRLEPLHRRVDEILLPMVAALLDLGQAAVRPIDRGLFELGCAAISRDPILRRHVSSLLRADAISTLCVAFDALGISGDALEPSIRRILLARAGWAGAVAWRAHGGGPSLEDYAAIRLIASIGCARDAGLSPEALFEAKRGPQAGMGSRADRVAQLLATQGVGPAAALRLSQAAFAEIEALIDCYSESWRCRVLQEAREATARRVWLAALRPAVAPRLRRPRAQIICCIDDREESLRRAAEERGGEDIETFGAAGHFQLNIRWRGARDVRPSSRHPIVLSSTHRVEERSLVASSWQRARGTLGVWIDGSLDPVRGAAATFVAGLPSLVLAAAHVLSPTAARRLTAKGRISGEIIALREQDHEEGLPLGFSEAEAADRIYEALNNIGLTNNFAPIVAVLGYRSTSENNPFASAYECGACGGSPGDGNARTFAKLANDPRVRHRLAERGLLIPREVRFVGGAHDTCTDEVILWPCADVPEPELSWLTDVLAHAAEQDAQERSRRFLSLPEGGAGRSHAAVRSCDLSEARPEYCHATNALLVVGPREATRGLFLDRRALLHSYDPE